MVARRAPSLLVRSGQHAGVTRIRVEHTPATGRPDDSFRRRTVVAARDRIGDNAITRLGVFLAVTRAPSFSLSEPVCLRKARGSVSVWRARSGPVACPLVRPPCPLLVWATSGSRSRLPNGDRTEVSATGGVALPTVAIQRSDRAGRKASLRPAVRGRGQCGRVSPRGVLSWWPGPRSRAGASAASQPQGSTVCGHGRQ
jgi:hypothetical protein